MSASNFTPPRPGTVLIQYIAYSFWVSMFPVFSTLVAPVLLVRVEQGQELLNAISDGHVTQALQDPPRFLHYVLFLLALLAWAFSNWYGSRLLMQRHFETHFAAIKQRSVWVERWNEWFPRVLGVVGMAVIAGYLLFARRQWIAGGIAALLVVLFLLFVISRRRLFRLPPAQAAAREVLGRGDRLALWLALTFSLVLLLGLALANFWLARLLGAPVILFIALASTVLFGSVALTYLPMAHGWLAMVWLPIVLGFGIAALGWNRNHAVVRHAVAITHAYACTPRSNVAQYFRGWVDARSQREHWSADAPIVLVAAEGGASRSAWWTAHVLSMLDYASDGEFSKHVFAVSGVSGGSLGAATYVALLAQRQARGTASPTHALAFPTDEQCRDLRAHAQHYPLPMQAECFVGRDYLSTTLGYLMFPDFLQRFVPVPVYAWDRSFGLERSWQIEWYSLFGTAFAPNPFTLPLQELYKPAGEMTFDLPLLLLNTARAKAGRSVVQSPVLISSSELDDAYDPRLRMQGFPLSAVVHNSARFPIVSPGGDVETQDGVHWDALVDGGYFEASGAATLAELVRVLARSDDPVVRSALPRLEILFIGNDPAYAGSIIENEPTLATDPRFGRQPMIRQEELLTPLVGLFSARSARGDSAQRALLDVLPKGRQGATEVQLSRGDFSTARPSMNWYLNYASRRAMWRAVAHGKNLDDVCGLLKRVVGPAAHIERIEALTPGGHAECAGQ